MFKSVCMIPMASDASKALSLLLRHSHLLTNLFSALQHSVFYNSDALERQLINQSMIFHSLTRGPMPLLTAFCIISTIEADFTH